MSKQTQKLFEHIKDGEPPKGAIETIQAVLPGLSLSKMFNDISEKAEQLWTQGRAEVAQALFTDGSAYVPYGPGQNPGDRDHDQPLHGLPEEAMKPPEQEQSAGRDM